MRFWLIQTGYFSDIESPKTVFSYYKWDNDPWIILNYMGSAEFEFGAIPQYIDRIKKNISDYEVVITDIQNYNGVPFILFCNKNNKNEIIEELKKYLDNPYQLKGHSGLEHHVHKEKSTDLRYYNFSRKNNQVWLDIEHDWFGMFGATDRQNALKYILKSTQEKEADE